MNNLCQLGGLCLANGLVYLTMFKVREGNWKSLWWLPAKKNGLIAAPIEWAVGGVLIISDAGHLLFCPFLYVFMKTKIQFV